MCRYEPKRCSPMVVRAKGHLAPGLTLVDPRKSNCGWEMKWLEPRFQAKIEVWSKSKLLDYVCLGRMLLFPSLFLLPPLNRCPILFLTTLLYYAMSYPEAEPPGSR
jgi:hypothetical protein